MDRPLKFAKSDRLHHRSLVESLFRVGKSFYEFPFRVSYRALSREELKKNFRDKIPDSIDCLQMLVTVPKKKRRRAVDRVLMRRRIREAYRLSRLPLHEAVENKPEIGTLSLALVYIHSENLPYAAIEEKIRLVISKMQKRIEECQKF